MSLKFKNKHINMNEKQRNTETKRCNGFKTIVWKSRLHLQRLKSCIKNVNETVSFTVIYE